MSIDVEVRAFAKQFAHVNAERKDLVRFAHGLVRRAVEAGWSERQLADEFGVDRMTIRSWLGKPPRKSAERRHD